MSVSYTVAHPTDDLAAMSRLISLAFGSPEDQVGKWLESARWPNTRIVKENGAPVSCLIRVPMAQFFGGRAVPMVGVAGVAVAPESRGRGLATQMMQSLLRELKAEGVPLSTLYPATLPLYRRVGYEQAGHWFEHRLAISRLNVKRSSLRVRPCTPADHPAILNCYRTLAPQHDGYLDRGEYIWKRITAPRLGPTTGFIVEHESGGVAGYVFLRQDKLPSNRHDIALTDIVAIHPDAAHRLLSFLSEFASVGEDILFYGGPVHPLMLLLPEQKFRMTFKEYWMLRILNIGPALQTRGYNPHITADLHLDLHDDLFPENSGKWLLHIKDGHAVAERGGSGACRLDVRSLAAMYTGFVSPRTLRTLGRIEADDASITAAAAAFSGPPPSLPDMF